jgi:quercetin dioxygenase-like cupin family protein
MRDLTDRKNIPGIQRPPRQIIFVHQNNVEMPFLDFNTAPHVQVLPDIHGAYVHSESITVGEIVLEAGAILPPHHHVHEQWTYVLEGQLDLTIMGVTKRLTTGQGALIPSHQEHSAIAPIRCRMIDVFTPVREDFKTLPPSQ